MTIALVLFIGILIGLPCGFLLPLYWKRRAHRSQWYPQAWYWFVPRRLHRLGYPQFWSVRLMRSLGID